MRGPKPDSRSELVQRRSVGPVELSARVELDGSLEARSDEGQIISAKPVRASCLNRASMKLDPYLKLHADNPLSLLIDLMSPMMERSFP